MTTAALLTHLLFALLLALLSWGITWWMLHRVEIMDMPNARSSHTVPTPRGGGVAIVATFIVGVVVIFIFADQAHIDHRYFWVFLLSAMAIALISFYDDLKNYSFQTKLATHILAVIIVLAGGVVVDELAMPVLGLVSLGWIGYVITFCWLLGLTNAYNFMDGIDGLAASTAVIASAFFAWITFQQGSHFMYIVSYTVLAGSAGFLVWNRPPARIFMGDVGSAFLGFVLAAMAIIAARYDMSHTSFLVMPLLLFHFIYDTVFTLIRRKLAGENITQAHNTHLYQLLVRMGMSHFHVTAYYCFLGVIQGGAALWMVQIPGVHRLLIFTPLLICYAGISLLIIKNARRKGVL